MNIGIVGLGLIGGSIAKAIKQNTEHKVYGTDIVESVIYRAKLIEAIDDALTQETLAQCDLVVIALYPQATIAYIRENAKHFKKGAIVMDCGGVKRSVCDELKEVSEQGDFTFIGAHPMAGVEFSGFKHSRTQLFKKASVILTPYKGTPLEVLNKVKLFCENLGFSDVVITTPEEHDVMIAFTSQLAHVVSSAYIKSERATRHKGFSAGSFKDMTRVAKLNETMWTELFLDNRDNLVNEIDELIEHLAEYRDTIKNGDEQGLKTLLKAGRERKESVGV